MLEFRLLGPLEVLADGEPVALPRKKQRALLSLLLLHAGEPVSSDRLIDDLWAGEPPPTARDALQNYVSQLRKALGKEVLLTQPTGYLLDVEPDQVDVGRFGRVVAAAREQVDAAARAELLREAVALWRGPPLSDVAYESFAGLEAVKLEEERAAARADLIDAELELGRGAELVPELEANVSERPFDERPRGQLMLALYRAGRQADALEAYQDARGTLVAELGLEPGAHLRELQQAILRQDPALDAPRPEPIALAERRKTVTVLFADLVGSTALAETLDPEAYQELLGRFFSAMRETIERHGGTVEKFVGDAVMAVFGVPAAHEDDALRAVRTAVDMRTALARLNAQLGRERGLELGMRIGVNTGEVFVAAPGGARALVTGAAVNQAKRLEYFGRAGDVTLGAGTLRLVRDAVAAKALKPRRRGRETPIPAFRLVELHEDAPPIARYLEAPLVGRDEELQTLLDAFGAVRGERRPRLVTVAGEPGIGKTRLVAELVSRVRDEALLLAGRSVPYGEGATYLPLREMIEDLDVAAALDGVEDAELVGRRVLELVGIADATVPAGEGAWAVRRLFEALAREQPLVIVLEDVHWAEATLLDLVDQLAERATGPILVVCAARPELLDERPAWADTALTLGPLAADDAAALLASLPGGDDVADDVRGRIVETAAGNPLFAEQLFAYVAERGPHALAEVPPSVEALIESRLDLLAPEERGLMQRAAVVGLEFTHAAVAELSPAEQVGAIPTVLFDLVRKGLVRPDVQAAADEAFRFHHVLVRDVAYAGLPKRDRARLHEDLGDWLGEQPDAQDEIVGHHLEQAYRYRIELGPIDRRAKQLAADAGARLGAAGIRAWKAADVPATVNLLGRATTLLPDDARRRELLCELGVAQYARGDTARSEAILEQTLRASASAGDVRTQLRASIELAYVGLQHAPEGRADVLSRTAEAAIPMLEAIGDDRALGRAWLFTGWVQGGHYCQNAAWEAAAERARTYYVRAGRSSSTCLGQIAAALYYGPTHVDHALARCEELLRDPQTDRAGRANVLRYYAGLVAMDGDVERGRGLVGEARTLFDELGQRGAAHYCDPVRGDIEQLAGNLAGAREARLDFCGYCERSGDRGSLSTAAADLADVVFELEEYAEADRWARVSEHQAASDDVGAQFCWRAVRAKLLARRGEAELAERHAREAAALAEQTDAVSKHAAVLTALAHVLLAGGARRDGQDAARRALELYEAKGNVAAAVRGRERLRALAGA